MYVSVSIPDAIDSSGFEVKVRSNETASAKMTLTKGDVATAFRLDGSDKKVEHTIPLVAGDRYSGQATDFDGKAGETIKVTVEATVSGADSGRVIR